MIAAAIIAHWSRYSAPIGSPGRRIARKIARNCTLALALPQTEGRTRSPVDATAPLSPMIMISRPMMISAIHGDTRPTTRSPTRAPETNSLSAVVSRKLPNTLVLRPSAGEQPVEEVRERGDREEHARRGEGRLVVRPGDDQREDHRDQGHPSPRHDLQERCGAKVGGGRHGFAAS